MCVCMYKDGDKAIAMPHNYALIGNYMYTATLYICIKIIYILYM